jgi:hypothetical protein
VGGSPRLPFEVGGPRFGSGPRFGRGPVVGTRIDCEEVLGRARRFEAATFGGGMREVVGFCGGAMRFGLPGGGIADGGGMVDSEGGFEALCAEFMAGKEGGGRLSSSSSSELSCSLSVKVGTAGASWSDAGAAFGVVSTSSCVVGVCSSMRWCAAGVLSSVSPCCDFSGIEGAADCVRRVRKASHVEGGRW